MTEGLWAIVGVLVGVFGGALVQWRFARAEREEQRRDAMADRRATYYIDLIRESVKVNDAADNYAVTTTDANSEDSEVIDAARAFIQAAMAWELMEPELMVFASDDVKVVMDAFETTMSHLAMKPKHDTPDRSAATKVVREGASRVSNALADLVNAVRKDLGVDTLLPSPHPA